MVERMFGLNNTTITTSKFPINPTKKMRPKRMKTTLEMIFSTFSSNGKTSNRVSLPTPSSSWHKLISCAFDKFKQEGNIFLLNFHTLLTHQTIKVSTNLVDFYIRGSFSYMSLVSSKISFVCEKTKRREKFKR